MFVVSNSPRLVELNLNFLLSSYFYFFLLFTFFFCSFFLFSLEQSQNKQANKISVFLMQLELNGRLMFYIFNFHKSKLIEKLIGISSKTASEFTVFSLALSHISYTNIHNSPTPHLLGRIKMKKFKFFDIFLLSSW